MRAFLHYERRAKHQLEAMVAFADGLVQHGVHCDVSYDTSPAARADFVVWWGDKVPEGLRDQPRLILEAGYINGRSGDYVRDRLQFISTGWNGLHGRADPGPPDRPPDRWNALDVPLLPWRQQGTHMLICAQHPSDAQSPPADDWLAACEEACRLHDCILRPHPLMAPNMRSLAWALDDAHSVLTWSSTAAIEAVLTGVPTVALDQGSIAWDACSHSVAEAPFLGSREQWGYNLAYRQWTAAELRAGEAWETIRHGFATKDCT